MSVPANPWYCIGQGGPGPIHCCIHEKRITVQGGGAPGMPCHPDSDPALKPRQCEEWACMALGGEVVEMLLYGSADPEGLWQDHPTVALALDQHPQGRALWPILRARAEQLLSAREALAAV